MLLYWFSLAPVTRFVIRTTDSNSRETQRDSFRKNKSYMVEKYTNSRKWHYLEQKSQLYRAGSLTELLSFALNQLWNESSGDVAFTVEFAQ